MNILLYLLIVTTTGCSFLSKTGLIPNDLKKAGMSIQTIPSGATVYYENQEIGTTPLQLLDHKIQELGDKSYAQLHIKKNNYIPVDVMIYKPGISSYSLTLKKYTPSIFRKEVLKEFQGSINILVRSILEAQGMLMIKNYKSLIPRLTELMKDYPYVGSLYTIRGVIHLQNKELKKAKSSFLKAIALDQNDSSAKMLLDKTSTTIK